MADATTIAFLTGAVILFIGALGEMLFRRTGLPGILFLILLGMLLGPGLSVLSPPALAAITPHLVALALIMILFHGGMKLDVVHALGQSGRATVLSVAYFLLVTTGVALAARFLLGFDWISSLLFGPMIAGTSSVVSTPLAQRLGLRKETAGAVSHESTITDVLNIVVFFALVEVSLSMSVNLAEPLIDLAIRFSIGILLGFGAGVLWLTVLYQMRRQEFTYIATLAVVIVTYFGSEELGGSGVLSVLAMGLVLGNDARIAALLRLRWISPSEFADLKSFLIRSQAEFAFLIRAFFFVFLGLLFNPSGSSIALLVGFALLFTAINLAFRYVAVFAATLRSPMSADRIPMTLLCGQGLAHGTLAILPLQLGLPNAATYPIIVAIVILITNLVTAIGAVLATRGRPVVPAVQQAADIDDTVPYV